jgi:hypothetical protein
MPAFRYFSLRQLGHEIGVGKSTISRVKNDLIMEGTLPWGDTEEPIPDYVPRAYSYEHKLADPFDGDYELKEEVFRFVRNLQAYDPRDWEFVRAEDKKGEHLIVHRGIVEEETWRFPVTGNTVIDGRPEHYEIVEEKPRRALTREELDQLAANRAKWEFFAARDRLMKHPHKRFREAVKTLACYREAPGLWADLRTFLLSGGSDAEHEHTEF